MANNYTKATQVNYWQITRIGAGAGIDTPCPAGKNLVNLIDFFPSGLCPGAGQDNLVDFSPAAEPGAFSITENTERTEKNGNFSSKRRITQIMRIKGGSRSITSELLEFFAGGRAWRFFYYRKYGKN